MFYFHYIMSELRRRKGRTALTAIGLGVGVALVIAVTSLSAGLDDAQDEILQPLTGLGTDISVHRPILTSKSGGDTSFSSGGAQLSSGEQSALRKENSGMHLDFANLGTPGEKFSKEEFVSTDLSFSDSRAARVATIDGVGNVGQALTLDQMSISGTVPESGGPGGPGAGAPGMGPGAFDISQASVTGFDPANSKVAALAPAQVIKGKYLEPKSSDQAVLTENYARTKSLGVGDSVKVGGKSFDVVGIAKAPLGGQSSDIYIDLARLQTLSKRKSRINALQVRAESAGEVTGVASEIEQVFPGAQVTTASDLADRVGGSLVDAKNLSQKLGTLLAILALLASFAIASLLTLISVGKRTAELGTLKAVGWNQWLVVRQISGESLMQGVFGGIIGVTLGVLISLGVGAAGWTLQASVSGAGDAPSFGPFGQGAVEATASDVTIGAPINLAALALAVVLAMIGGLVAGAAGSARAARLRPAEALRSVD